jgi:hypothetical protein
LNLADSASLKQNSLLWVGRLCGRCVLPFACIRALKIRKLNKRISRKYIYGFISHSKRNCRVGSVGIPPLLLATWVPVAMSEMGPYFAL